MQIDYLKWSVVSTKPNCHRNGTFKSSPIHVYDKTESTTSKSDIRELFRLPRMRDDEKFKITRHEKISFA